jgi:exosome complex component RRP45
MQYITPKNDTSTLSLPERTFLRAAARGTLSSSSKLLRLDGRNPSESRPIRLSFTRCHNRSECVVQFASGTRSAVSVHAELVPPPNADRPNDGQVKFSVDVGPMASMGYEVVDRPVSNYGATEAVDGGQMGSGGGGGGDNAPYVQKLQSNRILRILERTLLIGGAMDAEALCVQSGTWVWRLHVDVSLLDDGGNAMDASILAAVAALRHYRLPEVNISGGDDTDNGDNTGGYQETTIIHSDDREPAPLPLHHTPLTATFALFADESGQSTAVSALLDPSDREELACDGLLTWSYNKYGEMCCLDFPGGCELRPRQLMASAKLGKRRCVEICELLETALDEAEGKAQKERMARLKVVNDNRPSSTTIAVDDNVETSDAMNTDHQTDKEEEEYRKIALDYSSGHFAASVKEDKDKKIEKNPRNEPSSLFSALLRSAQASSMNMETDATTTATSDTAKDTVQQQQREEPTVEIIARGERTTDDASKNESKEVSKQPSVAADSEEEEEVVQLTSEFTTQLEPAADKTIQMDVESSPKQNDESHKASPAKKSTKSKSAVSTEEEDDITDLSQALKKKKKKKKTKK